MEREKGQLTLFDCRKVVSSNTTWGMFEESEIVQHKQTLLRPESSMHLLLNTLRKLDCYRLQLSDLSGTEIGRAAATLAAHHPRQEVARLAGALVDKWRVQGDGQLFSQLEYDAEAAVGAPEGDPEDFKLVAPPPPPPEEPPPEQPTRVQPPRKDRATRIKEEDDFLEGSDFEGISESDSEADRDWRPAGFRRKSESSTAARASGRQKRKVHSKTHVN